MPAASYREGPDGHSSRKQNSKRRRAKCSPSFVAYRTKSVSYLGASAQVDAPFSFV